jgi:hypothetical protein
MTFVCCPHRDDEPHGLPIASLGEDGPRTVTDPSGGTTGRCSVTPPRALPRADAAPGPPSECSTACLDDLDCPVIADKSVPPSAVDPRSERRSDDGQMIFEALPAVREPGPDLGFRGAPLRNRTVDLLLTMDHQTVPVSTVGGLNGQNASSR